jgi:hypothetical protein
MWIWVQGNKRSLEPAGTLHLMTSSLDLKFKMPRKYFMGSLKLNGTDNKILYSK